MNAKLEHVNITVSNAKETAHVLCKIFDWRVRWHGPAINEGYTYHVGTDDQYVAVYSPKTIDKNLGSFYATGKGMNHLAIVVDDLQSVEKRIFDAGFTPFSHGDYEPGRRFYFRDHDNIEFEIVSYK